MLPFQALRMRNAAAAPTYTVPTYITTGAVFETNNPAAMGANYPTGLQANDIAIIHVNWDNINVAGPISLTVPSGWTQVDQQLLNASNTKVQAVFLMRLAGTESGSVVIAGSTGSGGGSGCRFLSEMSIYRGCVASGSPFEGANHANGGNTTTPTHPSVVTTGPNRLVLSTFAGYLKTTYTPNAAYTGRYSLSPSTGNAPVMTFAMSDQFAASAGTVAAVNGACDSVSFSVWGTIGFALLPV